MITQTDSPSPHSFDCCVFSALCSKDYLYTVSPSPAAAAEAAVSQIAAATARPGICAKDAPMEWLFAFPLIQLHPSLAFLWFLRFQGAFIVVLEARGSSPIPPGRSISTVKLGITGFGSVEFWWVEDEFDSAGV